MADLDGRWIVRREGGLLPPMVGVRKQIAGSAGVTTAGPLRFPFEVVGRSLRYRFPPGLVDELEPDGDGFRGRAFLAGRELGRFRLERAGAARVCARARRPASCSARDPSRAVGEPAARRSRSG